MADEEQSRVLPDLELLQKNDQLPSDEDKDEVIKNLRRELKEEIAVTNSLTHTVAEKTAEIEHLQVKIAEQEARIYNFEDQIEEWTTQADSCDKLLEQKDCEIEMLQKSLKIEKQQRRDLEDMTMEAGKESILQKETLEKTIITLQEQIDHMNREKLRGLSELKEDPEEDMAKVVDISISDQVIPADIDVGEEAENAASVKGEEKKPAIQKEEYKADMEVLMDDLFALIKQNEELKEEIDRLKAEQSNMVENSRNVVKELETTIVEKAAEIQQQKHEIRRLSSAIEANDVGSRIEPDVDNQIMEIREVLQQKIDDLVSINSELKMRLDGHESTKESVTNQYNKMKQKLQFEREQNTELNKQILEVSNLYDTYYTKFNELEKGRIKGIDSAFSEQTKGSAVIESSLELAEAPKEADNMEPKTELARQESENSEGTASGDDIKSEEANLKKITSNKEKCKLDNQLSLKTDTQPPSKSESVLMLIVNLAKLLLLLSVTFFVVTSLRVYYGFSIGQISSTVFATYVFLYNLWRVLSKDDKSRIDGNGWKDISLKLRQAMKDLILRLDEKNFEQFKEIYESFIVQSFDVQEQHQPHNSKNEIQYLTSSNNILAKKLAKFKGINNSIHADYNQLKREIDILRIKRIEEEEVNHKMIQSLKEEIKSMEFKVSKIDMTDDSEILNGFMQGSLLKLLLFAILEGFVLMSASSSFILIPASFLSLVLLALVYRTDLHLRYATNENQGYQKTVKELLHKVSKCKEEEKQTSDEVRELEAVVDKDYEIISKQRHAIERLERQLQRAITKYREKKRILEKFFWLQEQNISNFHGLNKSGLWPHSGVDEIFNKNNRSVIDNEETRKWKWFGFKIFGLAVMSYAAVLACENYGFYFFCSADLDPIYFATVMPIIFFAFIFIKRQYGHRVNIQRNSLKAELKESRDDQQALLEQIEMLRSLIASEREFVVKLEKQIEGTKELPERKIPKEEVNAVIDRLIEVSKQRDELVMTASSAKDKYDHIKKTLDDILSREKYLSDEVSSLRFQKRELQNDLMKEQLKNIEMYEEVKGLKNDSKKEESSVQESDTEWDFTIEDFIKQSIDQQAGISPESAFTVESDSVLETLEQAGSYAQKNRKKQNSKRRDKRREELTDEACSDGHTLQPLLHDEVDYKVEQDKDEMECIPEKEGKVFGVNGVISEQAIVESAKQEIEDEVNDDGVECIDNNSERVEDKSPKDKASNFTQPSVGKEEENEMRSSTVVASRVGEEKSNFSTNIITDVELMSAKDSEFDILQRLLDTSQSNISRENSDSGTDCEKKIHFNNADMRSQQQEMGKLVSEIFSLADLCSESEVNLKVELDDLASRPEDLLNFLTDHVILIRYRILADKADMVAKVNSMEEEMEQSQQKIEKLHADVAREKQARNHVISEYEKEYERLESRLSVAYENIKKRLMEERSLRNEIMVQYEDEIDDIQAKTTKILKGLQEQLKQERKEKKEAFTRIESMAKKIKELEAELTSIEEVEKSNQVYVNLTDLLIENSEENEINFQQPHTIKLQRLVEEEAKKRTQILRGKLDEAMRDLDECKMKASLDDLIIKRFEEQDKELKMKMDIQCKRMKDMENEIRNPANIEDKRAWTVLRKAKAGVIYNISTKNGSSKWENPSDMGIVKVTRSSAGFGNATDILNEKPMPCSTENLEESWFQLDLGQDKSFVPKSYSFCHGWLSLDGCARNWVFEGSADGDKWHILREHVMDTSLSDRFMCGSWQLLESHLSFRFLRIRMTGPNSSNTNELFVGGMDVCGDIL